MKIEDSFFYDNAATQVTNGFQATESTLQLTRTKIDNCRYRNCNRASGRRQLQDEAAPSDDEVLAGFFYFSSRSSIDLASSILTRIKGKIGSAIMLMTGSGVDASAVEFSSLTMPDTEVLQGAVINAQNGAAINIAGSFFGNNTANDVYAASTPVAVTGTTFRGPIPDAAGYQTEKPFPFI